MKEIERKFLAYITGAPTNVEKHIKVRQGYVLAGKWVEWRIRQTLNRLTGATTWHTAFKFGNGLVRREYEWKISQRLYRWLYKLTPRSLHKERYLSNGWEVDRFFGWLHPLVLAEAELPTADAPLPALPEWLSLVDEVTNDGRFANKWLARLTPDQQHALAQYIGAPEYV